MADDIIDSLRREISETQRRREKLHTLKLTFVTGLLGLGGVKFEDKGATTYQLLYLAPLVGVFFDLLIFGEHFSIRRIGAFFRVMCSDKGEKEWQDFVKNRRDKFFQYGTIGFTTLIFITAIILLKMSKNTFTTLDGIWFGLIFFVFVIVTCCGRRALNKLDKDD